MRLFFIMMFVSIGLTHAASSSAQTIIFNNEKSTLTIEDVLNKIEEQSDYTFFYNPKQIDVKRRTNVSANKKEISIVLNELFKNTNISYTFRDRSIILSSKETPKTSSNLTNSPQKDIAGIILDVFNDPIVGASISIENTSAGTLSDIDGRFSLPVAVGQKVRISYLGFLPQEIEIQENTSLPLQITLKEDFQKLDEIVVVGYGVQKRSDLSGSISTVTAEKINSIPTSNVAEMLRGAAAGLHVTLGSAAPGGSSTIQIRGKRSLTATSNPLFIVDGVPMAGIDDINSNDVTSIEVLKDAAAQSIYGARAASGVILVTTKRGVSGKPRINYSSYLASQSLDRNFEFYKGDEWAAYRKEAYYNAYQEYDEFTAFKGYMRDVLKSKEYVDWEKLMISSAWQHKHDLSIQGGGEKTMYALSLGYYYQDGMVMKSDFERMSGRLNIDHQLFRNVKIGSNIMFSKSWQQTADGTFNSFITMPPLAVVYAEDGSLLEDVTGAGESHINPLWNISNSENTTKIDRLHINMFVDWKIFDWLSFRSNASLSNRYLKDGLYQGVNHASARNYGGRAVVSSSENNDYLLENIFNLEKSFTSNHKLDATLMHGVSVIKWHKTGHSATGFPTDDLGAGGISAANEYGAPAWELSDRKLLSYLGRVRYNLFEKYLFTAALRIDGASVFGKNNKYGYFPSAAFAWRASEESFLKDVDFLSNLKLRLSYGRTGNQAVGPSKSLGLTEKYYTQFGEKMDVGYLPDSELYNPDLKWETSTTFNTGLDFGFIDGRLSGSFEFYDIQTTDLLVLRSIPHLLGYKNQMVNLGHVQNRGIEITLNTIPIKTKNFSWNFDVLFAKNNNKIKKIDGSRDENGDYKNDISNKWFIGHAINAYYDYAFDGIWQLDDDIANSHMPTATPGSIKLKDVNNDGKLTEDDRIVIRRDPKWTATLSTGFKYRNLDLSADFYISHGGYIYNTYLDTFSNGGDMTGKRNGIRRDYWTTKNPSNTAPAPNMVQMPANMSALAYERASYMRLRNVTLGYNVPNSFTRKFLANNLRIYGRLTNFWTKTDVRSYSPEQTPGNYPEPKTVLFGLNVTF